MCFHEIIYNDHGVVFYNDSFIMPDASASCWVVPGMIENVPDELLDW